MNVFSLHLYAHRHNHLLCGGGFVFGLLDCCQTSLYILIKYQGYPAGDVVILVTKYSDEAKSGYLGKEIQWLEDAGYKVSDDGWTMFPPDF